jgi:general secretion pathway protein H
VILPAGKNSPGFSLIELMLVLVLLGISSMIVLPAIDRGLKNREARQTAVGLAAFARGLSERARSEGYPQPLTLNLVENSYSAVGDPQIQMPASMKFLGVEGGETTEQNERQFLFFPNGSNLGGTIRVGSETAAYAIRLHPLTGRVQILSGDTP